MTTVVRMVPYSVYVCVWGLSQGDGGCFEREMFVKRAHLFVLLV